jgi:hypothetical protein
MLRFSLIDVGILALAISMSSFSFVGSLMFFASGRIEGHGPFYFAEFAVFVVGYAKISLVAI